MNLDSRGFAEAEQHRAQLPPTPTLQELAKVTTMHVLNKGNSFVIGHADTTSTTLVGQSLHY